MTQKAGELNSGSLGRRVRITAGGDPEPWAITGTLVVIAHKHPPTVFEAVTVVELLVGPDSQGEPQLASLALPHDFPVTVFSPI
jgi:hypothetical protein